jgi:hypothetical protein
MRVFNPNHFQVRDELYNPVKVQIKVGFYKDSFHFSSEEFDAEKNSEEQYFTLKTDEPVIGTHI